MREDSRKKDKPQQRQGREGNKNPAFHRQASIPEKRKAQNKDAGQQNKPPGEGWKKGGAEGREIPGQNRLVPAFFLQNIEKAGIEGSERGSEGDERERGQKKDEIQLDQLPEAVGQDREKTGEGARCTPFVSQDDTSLRFVL